MLVYLPVVRRARSKYSRQGNVFRSGSQELGKAPLKIGGALQTKGKQTHRGYSIQGVKARRYGTTQVQRKVQTNYRRMWMARECRKHGSPECNSLWTQKSNGVSEMFEREPRNTYSGQGHRDCYGHLQHWQQPQPYNKGQLKFTSSKEITKKMENQKKDTGKFSLPKTKME